MDSLKTTTEIADKLAEAANHYQEKLTATIEATPDRDIRTSITVGILSEYVTALSRAAIDLTVLVGALAGEIGAHNLRTDQDD